MRQKIKIDKRTVIIISIYLFCLIDIAVFVPFQIKECFVTNSKTRELEKNVAEFKSEESCKEKKISRKEEIRREIFNLKNKIITSGEISALHAYISGKAKDSGLEVASIIISQPETCIFYKRSAKALAEMKNTGSMWAEGWSLVIC